MNIARSRIRPDIGQEQHRFVKDTKKSNAMFMLKMILERSIKIQRDVYLCFNDHTKVFDKLGHQEYLELLVNHDI